MARILVIDDNETMRMGVAHTAKRMGHLVEVAASGAEGVAKYKDKPADFVISDLKMSGMSGIEVIKEIRAVRADALIMIITGFGTVEDAVEAMKLGAFDFITKPFPPDVLRMKIQAALRFIEQQQIQEKLIRHNEILREEVEQRYTPNQTGGGELVGASEGIGQITEMIQRIAHTDSTVFIFGESGTGKELVARAIHRASRRREGPFIKVNCGALTESLLESELFGHEKGSFTNAHKRKLGRFELADGGTLFLDEIGDLSPAIQLKLLRVLQEREFERVGGEDTISVDVRIVSATHKDLNAEVQAGRFRHDLYYRLHIVPLILPPLRARLDDIPPLVEHFIEKLRARTGSGVRGVDEQALHQLKRYAWPGNVRELENVIEQSLVFARGEQIQRNDLPAHIGGGAGMGDLGQFNLRGDRALPDLLDDIEKQLILKAFDESN
ncbi:sigma-54 dependent transcriptional regulator, partial [Myxococcota bacterium]|nr:sigma-54 dependent transcriptional regulator [Myxococcota bacterium]